jgi:2-polyprenyl-3-methyl-5-hydroxy-6-metoxy-1,4-benzoquinol methylase
MISNEYKQQLNELNGIKNFGKRKKIPKFLESFIMQHNPNSIIDFGCGVGSLVLTLQETYPKKIIKGFDPGNKKFEVIPEEFFDLLISTDVLEHIELEYLDETLKFLSTKSSLIYHLIALEPSSVILPDGRNAHLILESPEWWRNKFLSLGYTILKEHHMKHINKKKNKLVNKYFIMAIKN